MWNDVDSSTSEEESVIVKEMVQAIMMLDFTKKPFKKVDITSLLSHKPGRNIFSKVLEEVKNCLDSLGLTLVEVKDTSVKSFFLISKQKPLQFMHKYDNQEEVSNRILLTLVLSYINIENGMVISRDLLEHLKKLKIYMGEDQIHPYFGRVKKKVLHDFVDQLYLSSKKLPDSDLCEIRWGQRAEMEISKDSIDDFISRYGFCGKETESELCTNTESDEDSELTTNTESCKKSQLCTNVESGKESQLCTNTESDEEELDAF